MALFALVDTRGGMSDEPPATLPENQVEIAVNVHWWKAPLGARRNGAVVVATGVSTPQYLAVAQPSTSLLYSIDSGGFVTKWDTAGVRTAVTLSPADTLNLNSIPRGCGLPAHGKLFFAAASNVARGHVIPSGGTAVRRTGMAASTGAPSAVGSGSGTFSGTRYYRYRLTEMSGATILRRSEPSPVTTATPPGTTAGFIVGLNGVASEGETHWELEESINNADFYRIATIPIGTTTVSDTTAYTALALTNVLSADIGDYTLPPSARLLAFDHDRILMGGDNNDGSKDSDVVWTPPGNDLTGVGNDERLVAKYNPRVSLDGDAVGDFLTDLQPFDTRTIAFKKRRIYALSYTGSNTNTYTPDLLSDSYGAMTRSVVEAVNRAGTPALYFTDERVGPCRLGSNGLEILLPQMQKYFLERVDIATTYTRGAQVFYNADQREVWWHFSMLDGTVQRWVFNTLTEGFSMHTLPSSGVVYSLASVPWSIQSRTINRPAIFGITTGATLGLYLGNVPNARDDCGNAFRAYVRSRAYQIGGLIERSQFAGAVVEGDAISGATLALSIVRDYGLEISQAFPFTFTTSGYNMAMLDNARLGEMTTMQLEWGDPSGVSVVPWRVTRIAGNVERKGRNV